MELRSMLISLLLFSGIITGLSVFMADLSADFSKDVDDLATLSSVERIQEESISLEEALRTSQITGTALDLPIVILSGAYSIFKLILVSFVEIWAGFINQIAIYLFLPSWFVAISVSIVVLLVVFEVLSVIMKYPV